MYCKHCGQQIDDNAKFCQHCGGNLGAYTAQEPIKHAAPEAPQQPVINVVNQNTNVNNVGIPFKKKSAGKELVDRAAMRRNELRDWIGLSPDDEMNDVFLLENYLPTDRLGDQKKLNKKGGEGDGD